VALQLRESHPYLPIMTLPDAAVSPIQDRGVYVSAERWQTLRSDPAFIELVRLARATNQLTLAWPPLLATLDDQSPKARRERFAAFFYAVALMHEALHMAQSLGKYFRDLPQYKAGFGGIFADQEIGLLRTTIMDRIRNRLVFHFDRDSLAEGLSHFPQGETLIATAPDFQQGEIYFDLADDALLGYLFGDASTETEYVARVARVMEQGTHLFQRFMRAAHSLIPAALKQMGCYLKPVDRPAPPPE